MDREEFEEIHFKARRRITFRMTLLYILSLIPLMGLVIPVFYVIYLGNGYFRLLEEMRGGSGDAGEAITTQGEEA